MTMVRALEVNYKGETRVLTSDEFNLVFDLIDEVVTQVFFIDNMNNGMKETDIIVTRRKRRAAILYENRYNKKEYNG